MLGRWGTTTGTFLSGLSLLMQGRDANDETKNLYPEFLRQPPSLRFVSAVLPNSRSPLETPAQLLLSIRRPAPAVGGEQALGWDVVNGTDLFVVKDGVTAGQAATIALDPPKQTGVVVLSNALPVNLQPPPGGGVGAADLARHLLRPALPLGEPTRR